MSTVKRLAVLYCGVVSGRVQATSYSRGVDDRNPEDNWWEWAGINKDNMNAANIEAVMQHIGPMGYRLIWLGAFADYTEWFRALDEHWARLCRDSG